MKHIFAFLCVFLVLGCSRKAASVSVAEAAKESITAAFEALPKECKTDTVKQMLVSAKAQVDAVTVACDTEKDVLRKRIANLETIIGIILGIGIGLLVWRRGR